jgi:hypothetical protein
LPKPIIAAPRIELDRVEKRAVHLLLERLAKQLSVSLEGELMPLELGVWRIDSGLEPVDFGPLDIESRLEDILDANVSIASPNWLVIGRQVRTDYGAFIDLIALDRDANLVVLELKRDRTYRDIVAQVLDYGSWVRELKDEQIAQIFDEYQKRWHKDRAVLSIDEAFKEKFCIAVPDEMNSSHELVVVVASLDSSTERIIRSSGRVWRPH